VSPHRRRKLLAVDDTRSDRELLRMALERAANVDVTVVPDGKLALVLARAHHPDAVIVDYHLAGEVSGAVVLAELKSDPDTAEIPVVMLSGDDTPGLAEHLIDVGAAAFLRKTGDVSALAAAVLRACQIPRP
jgi:CheY-like chemotaxis protein